MKRGIDYIGVGVGAMIFNEEGKIFITKRGQACANDRGKWEIPGGGVEYGEMRKDAVIREVKEENDIEIEVIEELQTSDHFFPEDGLHWVTTSFICRYVSGEPKRMEPEKCEAIGWFSIEEADKLELSEITKRDLTAMKAKYRNGYRM